MKRIFGPDAMIIENDPGIVAYRGLVYDFVHMAVEFAVDHDLDLNDAQSLWHQMCFCEFAEAFLKQMFKHRREGRDAIGNP